jgi:hypothetical protein
MIAVCFRHRKDSRTGDTLRAISIRPSFSTASTAPAGLLRSRRTAACRGYCSQFPDVAGRATLSRGTVDVLPHNGIVLLLLQITKPTHGDSRFDMVMTVIAAAIISFAAVIVLGATFGSL